MKVNKIGPSDEIKRKLISDLSRDEKNIDYAKKLDRDGNNRILLKCIVTTLAVACAAIIIGVTAFVSRELLHEDNAVPGASDDLNYIIIDGQLVGTADKDGFITNGKNGYQFTFAELFANKGFYNGTYKYENSISIEETSVDREALDRIMKYCVSVSDGVSADGKGMAWYGFELPTEFEQGDLDIPIPDGTSFSFFISYDPTKGEDPPVSKPIAVTSQKTDNYSWLQNYVRMSDTQGHAYDFDFDGDGNSESIVYSYYPEGYIKEGSECGFTTVNSVLEIYDQNVGYTVIDTFKTTHSNDFEVLGVQDLDGDGCCEIVAHSKDGEVDTIRVYSYKNENWQKVISYEYTK